jgi:hypothetical protein
MTRKRVHEEKVKCEIGFGCNQGGDAEDEGQESRLTTSLEVNCDRGKRRERERGLCLGGLGPLALAVGGGYPQLRCLPACPLSAQLKVGLSLKDA